MERTYNVNGKDVAMECNAATPLICQRIFGLDLFSYFETIGDISAGKQVDGAEKMTFTMCLQASKTLKEALSATEDDFLEWLSRYDFDEMTAMITGATELWTKNNKTNSTPKNAKSPQ